MMHCIALQNNNLTKTKMRNDLEFVGSMDEMWCTSACHTGIWYWHMNLLVRLKLIHVPLECNMMNYNNHFLDSIDNALDFEAIFKSSSISFSNILYHENVNIFRLKIMSIDEIFYSIP